jgi:hypothetical protein
MLSMVAALIYIPTNSVFFPKSSPIFLVVCFLDDSHSDWGETDSHAVICIIFIAKDVEHFFTGLLVICTSFENCLIHLPISWSVCFFGV